MKNLNIFRTFMISNCTFYVLLCALSLSLLLISCVDNSIPEVYNGNDPVGSPTDRPTITSIAPASEAVGGVREIQIRGSKLGIKNGTDTSWLYVSGMTPLYKQITDSLITIYRPGLTDDKYDGTIYINISDPNYVGLSSSIPYVIQKPGSIVGDYTGVPEILAMEFDKDENLISAAKKVVNKMDFAGVTMTTYVGSGAFVPGDYNFITDMECGSGPGIADLYILTGKNYIARKSVYDTVNNTRPVQITVPVPVAKLEVDENGDIYAGWRDGIIKVDSSIGYVTALATAPTVIGYAGVNIKQIRIIKLGNQKYIYVADSLHVWRSQLNNGTFTEKEETLVSLEGTALATNYINSIALDVNGGIFLCLLNHTKYSLFIRENDGSITPYYTDPAILPKTVDQIKWGNNQNGSYLYLVSGALKVGSALAPGRVYRMTMDRNGAEYYSRRFFN